MTKPEDKIMDHGYRTGVVLVIVALVKAAMESKSNPLIDMREIIEEFVSPDTDISEMYPRADKTQPLSPEEHLYCVADAFAMAIMLMAGKRII